MGGYNKTSWYFKEVTRAKRQAAYNWFCIGSVVGGALVMIGELVIHHW